MSVLSKNTPVNAEDDYCEKHGRFYEIYCPECSSDKDKNQYCSCKDAKVPSYCYLCDWFYCEKCAIGKSFECPRCKKKKILKTCGCEQDGKPSHLCNEHDLWYCNQCSDGKDICPKCFIIKTTTSNFFADLPSCACFVGGSRVTG